MKNYLIPIIIILFVIAGCSKTKEITKKEKEEPETRYTPPPSSTDNFLMNRPREGTLSAAEIQKLQDLATQKAGLECRMERLHRESATNNQQAVANKEKVIKLDAQLKVLQVDIDKFLDTKEKIQYFRRAFDQAFSKCNQ